MEDLLDTGRNANNSTPGTLPNATAVLVLGIISIVGCILYGVPGLICGIITLVLHKKDKALYLSNPEKYEDSYKTSRAGYVCGVVGTSLSALFFAFFLVAIVIGLSGARF